LLFDLVIVIVIVRVKLLQFDLVTVVVIVTTRSLQARMILSCYFMAFRVNTPDSEVSIDFQR